jgi:hypothetical protein
MIKTNKLKLKFYLVSQHFNITEHDFDHALDIKTTVAVFDNLVFRKANTLKKLMIN